MNTKFILVRFDERSHRLRCRSNDRCEIVIKLSQGLTTTSLTYNATHTSYVLFHSFNASAICLTKSLVNLISFIKVVSINIFNSFN